jgi:hypothetical protein
LVSFLILTNWTRRISSKLLIPGRPPSAFESLVAVILTNRDAVDLPAPGTDRWPPKVTCQGNFVEKIARHPFFLPVGTEEADNARATAPACAAQVLQDARGAVRRESQRRTIRRRTG